jgi:hypothetical protein
VSSFADSLEREERSVRSPPQNPPAHWQSSMEVLPSPAVLKFSMTM